MAICSIFFRKRYFQKFKEILEKFKNIQKDQRIQLKYFFAFLGSFGRFFRQFPTLQHYYYAKYVFNIFKPFTAQSHLHSVGFLCFMSS